jgi:hypothetical protein
MIVGTFTTSLITAVLGVISLGLLIAVWRRLHRLACQLPPKLSDIYQVKGWSPDRYFVVRTFICTIGLHPLTNVRIKISPAWHPEPILQCKNKTLDDVAIRNGYIHIPLICANECLIITLPPPQNETVTEPNPVLEISADGTECRRIHICPPQERNQWMNRSIDSSMSQLTTKT